MSAPTTETASPTRRIALRALRILALLTVVAGIGWFAMSVLYDDELPRVQANDGPRSVRLLLETVPQFYAENHRLPHPGDGLVEYGITAEPHVKNVQISPDTLVIIITYKGRREIDGKTLTLTPAVDAHGAIVWRCSLPDIKPRWWPDYCRTGPSP